MRIIVQKFGGTSVADSNGRTAAVHRIAGVLRQGYRPVVVVSAMGRAGDPYATDTLLDAAKSLYVEDSERELDLIASCGEIISTVIMVQTLRAHGIKATAMTGGQAGIITDENFTDARILRIDTENILQHLEQGEVVVVAGFQGVSERGEITTLGRGGSDTTAAALGAALGAEVVEIYTDVGGVYTADPRLVPSARSLSRVTYDEVAQMAVQGARVIHPRAVEIAMRANVPLRVRGTFVDDPGTLITHAWPHHENWLAGSSNPVTGIAHIMGLTLVMVADEGQRESGSAARSDLRIFRALADAGISVDMINVSVDRKAFVVRTDDSRRVQQVLAGYGFQPKVRHNCAKVTVIGAGMRGLPGVMAKIVEALDQVGVEILLSVDSHITISCLVDEANTERAVRALHATFQEIE